MASDKQLRIERITTDTLEVRRTVHNDIVATDALTADQVRARSEVNLMTLAYAGGTLVGNATVRPLVQTRPLLL